MAVRGDLVYFGNGSYLQIADIRAAGELSEIGQLLLPQLAWDMFVQGDFLYVIGEEGLLIVDISDPARPQAMGQYQTPDTGYIGLEVAGSIAYIVDEHKVLRLVNVGDPTLPVELGWLGFGDYLRGSSIAVNGQYAYVSGSNRLEIVDVSDPHDPVSVGFLSSTWAHDVIVIGDLAYWNVGDKLRILDASIPEDPREVGFIELPYTYNLGMAVQGTHVFLANYFYGIYSIDVTDPADPFMISTFPTEGNPWQVVAGDDRICLAAGDGGLRIIDMNDPVLPVETGFFTTGGAAKDVYYRDGLCYVAEGGAGLRILDVSDPSTITELGHFDTEGESHGVFVEAGLAFVADYYSGLRIIDVSDPSTPSETGYFDTDSRTVDVVVSGNRAYLADYHDGLRILDLTDLTNPVELGFLDTGGIAFGLDLAGDLVYLADLSGGMRIIDVSDPANPVLTGYFDPPGSSFNNLVVDGGLAYVAGSSEKSFSIIDVTEAALPVELGFLDLGLNVRDVKIQGQYAYLAEFENGLRIVDVSDPGFPVEVGYYQGSGGSLAVSDNIAYMTTGGGWLEVIRNDLSVSSVGDPDLLTREFHLNDAYPNPFNPSTAISFEFPRSSAVDLKIFDYSGRLVRVLLEGEIVPMGPGGIEWNGRDDQGRRVPSGVYVFRMESGGSRESKRVTLIK